MRVRTAVSIPEGLFERAEELAKRLGVSRSELYARAVERFLQQEEPKRRRKKAAEPDELDPITKRLNEIYADESNALDPVLERLQADAIAREEW